MDAPHDPHADIHFYEPAVGHRLPHDPLKAIVAPRPIGWIGTVDGHGRANLAPYSFFNVVADDPPLLVFSSSGRKHSVANAEATGAFTWSLATRALAAQMNVTSAPVEADVDEFALAALTAAPSRLVAPPRVAESPASFEARVVDVIELKDLQGRSVGNWLVIGQVVGVHIDRRFLTADGQFDTALARPVLRAGYLDEYAEFGAEAMFRMTRPAA